MDGEFYIEQLTQSDTFKALELSKAFKLESRSVSPEYDELNPRYAEILSDYLNQYCKDDDSVVFIARSTSGDIVGVVLGTVY